jgi:uncharacterized damage-inducible protein DinB
LFSCRSDQVNHHDHEVQPAPCRISWRNGFALAQDATHDEPVTWIAPQVQRNDPPELAGERQELQGWLDFHRATLLVKCQGLAGEQLVIRAVAPSTLTLLGLVRHMAEVERSWFRHRFAGELDLGMLYCSDEFRDGDFDLADPAQAEADFLIYGQECQLADAAAQGRSLEDTFETSRGGTLNLRWIYLHMIEEYARHNGHADIIREQIDGVTGD